MVENNKANKKNVFQWVNLDELIMFLMGGLFIIGLSWVANIESDAILALAGTLIASCGQYIKGKISNGNGNGG